MKLVVVTIVVVALAVGGGLFLRSIGFHLRYTAGKSVPIEPQGDEDANGS